MRKASSILFLSIWMLCHCHRIISYFQCQVENFIQNGVAICDCEKQDKGDRENGLASTSPQSNQREKPSDSEYTFYESLVMAIRLRMKVTPLTGMNSSRIPMGVADSIFQPPRILPSFC